MSEHLVIVGNGIAGITTARHVRKRSNRKITVISAETEHFFSRTALMYIYMGHMRFQDIKPYPDNFWKKNKIDLVFDYVEKIDTENRQLLLKENSPLAYDKLVLATGSKSNKFGWPGQDLPGVQGLYSHQDLILMEENTRGISQAVVVGGGLIGVEVTEMLLSRNIQVTFLAREEYYWDNVLPKNEAKLIGKHLIEHGVDLRLQTNLQEIVAGQNGRAAGVVTNSGEHIQCQFVALTPGVHPNIDLAKSSGLKVGRGVLVNDYLETSVADIFATGDCAEIVGEDGQKNRLEQLWYTGKMQGMALAGTICGKRVKYERGVWYNSAKFMDIEYQTYGFVSNLPLEGESSFYWESADGRQCIRINYRTDSEQITGLIFFGMRMRQEICQRWIQEGRKIDWVIKNLSEANFDPEFFKSPIKNAAAAYYREHNKS